MFDDRYRLTEKLIKEEKKYSFYKGMLIGFCLAFVVVIFVYIFVVGFRL